MKGASLNAAAQVLGRRGGLIGGKTTGRTKRRGNAAYYRALSAKSAAARKALARERIALTATHQKA